MSKKDRRPSKPPLSTAAAPIPFWRIAAGWVICAWVLFVVVRFNQKFPSSIDAALSLLDGFMAVSPANYANVVLLYAKSVSLWILLMLGVAGWGGRFVRLSPLPAVSAPERLLLSFGAGFVFLSMLIFGLGVAGGYGKGGLWSFFALFVSGGVLFGRSDLREWWGLISPRLYLWMFRSPAHFMVFFFLAFVFMMDFVPELFYDSLVYHLGLPQMFINEGRMVDTPYVYFSRFPMLHHMLYVLGVGLDGSTLAKLFNWSLLALGSAGIWCASARLGWPKGGIWAVLFIVSIPVVQMNVWATTIDSVMGTYTVLALVSFLLWKESGFLNRRLLVLFGLFAGAVFGIKYTGVIVVASLGITLFFTRRTEAPIRSLIENIVIYAFMVFLIIAPWLVRNFVWTGNPVYPLLSRVIPSRHINERKIQDEQNIIARSVPKSIVDVLKFPWAQTMLELSSFNFIGPMMLGGLPLLFLIPFPEMRQKWLVFAVTGFYFGASLRFAGDIRFLLSGFFLLSVLLAGGLEAASAIKPFCGAAIKTCLFVVACYHAVWVVQCAQGLYRPARVLMGAQSREDYSATMHDGLNLCPWNVMDRELKALPEPCRIYILGNEQVFGFPRPFMYSSCHDDTPVVLWANASQSSGELYQKFKSEKLTHILFNAPEAVRLKGYDLFPWTESGLKIFYEFAKQHLQVVDIKPIAHIQTGLFLFEIREQVDQPQPFGSFEEYFGAIFTQKPS